MAIPSISALPTVPSTNDSDFESAAQAFLDAMKGTFISEMNASIAAINAAVIGTGSTSFVDSGDSPYTMAAGETVFVDTSGGPVTVNLWSAPGVGESGKVVDWKGTFATNNCTLDRSGSNIEGSAANYTLAYNNECADIMYTEASYGYAIKERS